MPKNIQKSSQREKDNYSPLFIEEAEEETLIDVGDMNRAEAQYFQGELYCLTTIPNVVLHKVNTSIDVPELNSRALPNNDRTLPNNAVEADEMELDESNYTSSDDQSGGIYSAQNFSFFSYPQAPQIESNPHKILGKRKNFS